MAIDTHDDEAAARALLAAAEADTSPPARRLHTASHFLTRMLTVTLITVPMFFGVALWRFAQALQTDSWLAFWFAAVGCAALVVLPIYLYFYDPIAERNSGLAYAYLYNSVGSDNVYLGPVGSVSYTPTPRPMKLQYVQVIGGENKAKTTVALAYWGFYLVVLLFIVTWLASWASSMTPEMLAQAFVDHLPAFVSIEAFFIVSVFFVLFFCAGSCAGSAVGKTVHADESGLRWRVGFFGSRWRQVNWDTVRESGRFARLDVTRNKWEHGAYAFLLDIGDVLLTWGVNPFESAAGGAYTPKDAQAEWEQFAAFICAKSEVPLRDITPIALAIARATRGRIRERKVAQMLLAHSRTAEPVTIPGLQRAVALVAEQENPQRQRLLRTLAWIPLALFVMLYVVGAIIQFHG